MSHQGNAHPNHGRKHNLYDWGTKIKKTDNAMRWQGYRSTRTLMLCWWKQKGDTPTLETGGAVKHTHVTKQVHGQVSPKTTEMEVHTQLSP